MQEVTLIKPSGGWHLVNIRELWHYRDLLYFLTIRGIKAKYAQSILGVGWAIIQPLSTMIVFTIVFGRVAKIDTSGIPYPLFAFLGLWPWMYFSGTLTDSANSLVANAGMITKVYFPRLVLPLASVFSKLLDFFIASMIVVGLLIYYKVVPGISIIWILPLVVQLLFASLGIGMSLSALSVQYRDVRYALTFLVQLLMYGAPVVYSTAAVPSQYQFLFSLNPMVGVIEGFRAGFLNQPMPWHWIAPGTIVSIAVFFIGALFFQKMERSFADVA